MSVFIAVGGYSKYPTKNYTIDCSNNDSIIGATWKNLINYTSTNNAAPDCSWFDVYGSFVNNASFANGTLCKHLRISISGNNLCGGAGIGTIALRGYIIIDYYYPPQILNITNSIGAANSPINGNILVNHTLTNTTHDSAQKLYYYECDPITNPLDWSEAIDAPLTPNRLWSSYKTVGSGDFYCDNPDYGFSIDPIFAIVHSSDIPYSLCKNKAIFRTTPYTMNTEDNRQYYAMPLFYANAPNSTSLWWNLGSSQQSREIVFGISPISPRTYNLGIMLWNPLNAYSYAYALVYNFSTQNMSAFEVFIDNSTNKLGEYDVRALAQSTDYVQLHLRYEYAQRMCFYASEFGEQKTLIGCSGVNLTTDKENATIADYSFSWIRFSELTPNATTFLFAYKQLPLEPILGISWTPSPAYSCTYPSEGTYTIRTYATYDFLNSTAYSYKDFDESVVKLSGVTFWAYNAFGGNISSTIFWVTLLFIILAAFLGYFLYRLLSFFAPLSAYWFFQSFAVFIFLFSIIGAIQITIGVIVCMIFALEITSYIVGRMGTQSTTSFMSSYLTYFVILFILTFFLGVASGNAPTFLQPTLPTTVSDLTQASGSEVSFWDGAVSLFNQILYVIEYVFSGLVYVFQIITFQISGLAWWLQLLLNTIQFGYLAIWGITTVRGSA
jgi:hypothetical protein